MSMSTLLRIPAHEAHVLRVFAVDEAGDALVEDQAVLEALGAEAIKTAEVELFDVGDLQDMALSDYLAEGHGIPGDQLAPMRAQLNGLRGRGLLLPSRAFDGRAQEMRPRAPLRMIGRFSEEVPPVSFAPLPAGGAQGVITLKPDKRPQRQRAARWLALGFFAIMALVLALVISLAVLP
jgi:hypothetical protein